MVTIPTGLLPENDCAAESQTYTKDRPALSLERELHINKTINCQWVINI
jgi:hypothetical protein